MLLNFTWIIYKIFLLYSKLNNSHHIHILIPYICDYITSYGKSHLKVAVKLKILEWKLSENLS